MKILFVDIVHSILQEMLEKENHICVDGSQLSREEILKCVHEYDGIVIRSRIAIDKIVVEAALKLKFIARAGAGMESIDVDSAKLKGIVCLNSPEGSKDAVGEFALGMLLSLFRYINKADREVREGKWIREENRGIEIQGKTVGVIGYGNMGKSFAKKLSGFDCRVIAYDKYLKNFSNQYAAEVSLEKFFEDTDVLSLHVPLTQETTWMVNDEFIQRFKKNIYVINTARGKCLCTDDLVLNMKSGKVMGACLDVNEYEESSFEKIERQDTKHKTQDTRIRNQESEIRNQESWEYLLQSDRVILSPHIGGWTVESHEKISRVLFEKIRKEIDTMRFE